MLCQYQAIPALAGGKPSVATVLAVPSMDIFSLLALELDNEGRYHLLNAVANHLRFPNVHTHYFSSLMLALFSNAPQVRRHLSSLPFLRARLLSRARNRETQFEYWIPHLGSLMTR